MSDRLLTPRLVLLLSLGLASCLAQAADTRPWSALSSQERTALAPLAQDWDRFPAEQQARLLAVARHYPALSPQQQELMHKRLKSWSRLTSEQRRAARQNLSRIQTLSQEDQARIKQRWLDALCKEFTPPPAETGVK